MSTIRVDDRAAHFEGRIDEALVGECQLLFLRFG
jgi:hypothetical protein